MVRAVVTGCVVAAAIGCGADESSVEIAAECNPLGGVGCITPWPSSVYEAPDPSAATGVRLAIPDGALPSNVAGVAIDPRRFNEHDGFSPAGFAFTVFPEGVDGAPLVGPDEIERSLDDTSPTVLLDLETGERVPHFAELDANASEYELDRQALYVRPVDRLEPGRRYAVGIRRTLRARDGGPLERPAGFRALLQGEVSAHPRLAAAAERLGSALDQLEAAGIPRSELVVAWDFTTASDAFLRRRMLQAREAALVAAGERGANLTFEVDDDAPIGGGDEGAPVRRLRGHFAAPLVLTSGVDAAAELARDAAGAVVANGTLRAPFVALIPACAEARAPVPAVLFGHGFFGTLGEAQNDYMRGVANELCVAVVATEWFGMSSTDVAGAALALNDASRLVSFGERILQGIVNHLALTQLVRGPLGDALVTDTGSPLIDPERIHFYGISQGHVLGATFVAYDPVIERAALSVGGTNWSLLFERSTHWPTFHLIISGAYEGALNTIVIESLMQLAYDPVENMHVADHMLADPLPGARPKQILMHMAVDDSQVSNLATAMHARAMALPVLEPALKVPHGLSTAPAPSASALVIFDESPSPLPPRSNLRHSTDNGTHGSVRRRPAAVRQLDRFFADGVIEHTCQGRCSCATGACD